MKVPFRSLYVSGPASIPEPPESGWPLMESNAAQREATIEMNCLSDYRGISRKSSLPIIFAHQNRWRGHRFSSTSRFECATVQGGDSENFKAIFRDNEDLRELRVACTSSYQPESSDRRSFI